MSKEKRQIYALKDGTSLHYYYAEDDHGSRTENYTHRASNSDLIALYTETNTFKGTPEALRDLLNQRI